MFHHQLVMEHFKFILPHLKLEIRHFKPMPCGREPTNRQQPLNL
jgi:hypothetical protein